MPLPDDIGPGGRIAPPDQRVIRQLAAALVFEGLLPVVAEDGGRIVAAGTDGSRILLTGRRGPFGRLRLPGGDIRIERAGRTKPADVASLLAATGADAADRDRLAEELARTAGFCRWNAAHLAAISDRRALFGADLDQLIDEGHPYHPSFKARTGFGIDDHRRFGPEAGNAFRLEFVAIARTRVHQQLPGAEAAFLDEVLGPDTAAELRSHTAARGLDPARFTLMPVHPWQLAHLSAEGRLAPWLGDGSLHLLGPAGDRYRATQSVRTLASADRPAAPHVKLPLHMATTSALRTLEPHSVLPAPALSRWLGDVIADDPLFAARYPLTILPEFAGAIADRDGPLAGELAVLWRRSPEAELRSGEAYVPFNALALVETDGRSFIAPWLGRYGRDAWLGRLLEVAVLPVWHLFLAHGIGTEAHAQNMLLVHRDGWPERLMLRDFHESVEYSRPFLARPELEPDFLAFDPAFARAAPDQFYWTETTEPVRDLVTDCLFTFNLTDLSALLERCHGLPEPAFWHRLAARLAGHAAEHGLEARARVADLGAPVLMAEQLVARKLFPGRADHRHPVPNALAPRAARRSAA
ncbi:IucA/IucC family protein [Methylobrevis albus]|uniref:IucA/IucC family protein n=1 Tax=Methylobrevis albus TaxID=2793297 RepID=UPI002E2DEF74|nr:IucA/IucC family protein [Methylobrevis albus]